MSDVSVLWHVQEFRVDWMQRKVTDVFHFYVAECAAWRMAAAEAASTRAHDASSNVRCVECMVTVIAGGESVAPAPLAHVPPVLSLQPTFGKLFHPQSGGVQSWGSCLVWGWGAGYY